MTRVTDAGVAHLKDLRQLWELHLSETDVSNARLCAYETRVNWCDWRLEVLMSPTRGCPSGNWLTASARALGTRITDAGLPCLQGMTQLSNLDLRHTKVTVAGVKRLQQALPNCAIEQD